VADLLPNYCLSLIIGQQLCGNLEGRRFDEAAAEATGLARSASGHARVELNRQPVLDAIDNAAVHLNLPLVTNGDQESVSAHGLAVLLAGRCWRALPLGRKTYLDDVWAPEMERELWLDVVRSADAWADIACDPAALGVRVRRESLAAQQAAGEERDSYYPDETAAKILRFMQRRYPVLVKQEDISVSASLPTIKGRIGNHRGRATSTSQTAKKADTN
jgi:hypothetical protein